MKPFDLELAKQGTPVCTRDGRNARIICFDRKNPNNMFPIVALVEYNGVEKHYHYTNEGKFGEGRFGICEYGEDLMMATEKHEGYLNIYGKKNMRYTSSLIHDTFEKAVELGKDGKEYITTVKITWEE